METTRIIKRYQNRKLYDTHQSCYVTLEEIAQIIRDGHEIKVIDNKTKRDITYSTQIQLLFDQEKKTDGMENTSMLKRVIQSQLGTFTTYIKSLEQQLQIGSHEFEERLPDPIHIPQPVEHVPNHQINPGNFTTGIETPTTLN